MSFKSGSLSFRQGNVNSFGTATKQKSLDHRGAKSRLSMVGVGLHLNTNIFVCSINTLPSAIIGQIYYKYVTKQAHL